jgi:O-antigen/teichoic acid export membrane protein
MPGFNERSFAVSALTIGIFPALIVIALMNLNTGAAAAVLFGKAYMSRFVAPTTIALAGLTLHSMVYAVFRGRGDMRTANILSLVNMGIVPMAAFLIVRDSAAIVLTVTGVTWVLTSFFALLFILLSTADEPPASRSRSSHTGVLLRYGLPRIPGEFALVGLFALPALIAVRSEGIVRAGHLSAGMSLLTLVAGVFAPVGLVLLPRASAQAASGDLHGLRQIVLKMMMAGVALAVVGVAIGELLIPPFVRWYFGSEFIPAIPIFRVCLLGAIPYSVYVLLRNVLDALDVKPINSRNLVITLAFLLVLCFVRRDVSSMSLSLLASLTLLGVLSLWETQQRLGKRALSRAATVPVSVPTV